MGAKKVRVEFIDGSGQPVAGVVVKASGCGELQTAVNGQAFFLVEDERFSVFATVPRCTRAASAACPRRSCSGRPAAAGRRVDAGAFAAEAAPTTASADRVGAASAANFRTP